MLFFFFSFVLSKKNNIYYSILTFFFFILCYFLYFDLLQNNFCFLILGTWFKINLFIIQWTFYFDYLTWCMFLLIIFITFIVYFYSIYYLWDDPHLFRFLSYLFLFAFFMFWFISSLNFIQMFLGWEGVGLCSYLLINFWTTRYQAIKAAIKAILYNKIGDILFISSCLFLQYFFLSTNSLIFFSLNDLLFNYEINFFIGHIKILTLINFFF